MFEMVNVSAEAGITKWEIEQGNIPLQPSGCVTYSIGGGLVQVEVWDYTNEYGSRVIFTVDDAEHRWSLGIGDADDPSIDTDTEAEETLNSIDGVLKVDAEKLIVDAFNVVWQATMMSLDNMA